MQGVLFVTFRWTLLDRGPLEQLLLIEVTAVFNTQITDIVVPNCPDFVDCIQALSCGVTGGTTRSGWLYYSFIGWIVQLQVWRKLALRLAKNV